MLNTRDCSHVFFWERQYILAYSYIEYKMKENVEEGLHEINIDQIKKNKTHWSAITFEEKYLN